MVLVRRGAAEHWDGTTWVVQSTQLPSGAPSGI